MAAAAALAAPPPPVWELAGQAVAAYELAQHNQAADAVHRGEARFLEVEPPILAFWRALGASHGRFVVRHQSSSPLCLITDIGDGGTSVRVCTVQSSGRGMRAVALGRAVGDADDGKSYWGNGNAVDMPFIPGARTTGHRLLHVSARVGVLVRCRASNDLGNTMYRVALTGVSAVRDAVRAMRVDDALRRHAPVFVDEVVPEAPTINDVVDHFDDHRVAYAAAGHNDDFDAFMARVRGEVAGYGWPACLQTLADAVAPLAYLGLRVLRSEAPRGRPVGGAAVAAPRE